MLIQKEVAAGSLDTIMDVVVAQAQTHMLSNGIILILVVVFQRLKILVALLIQVCCAQVFQAQIVLQTIGYPIAFALNTKNLSNKFLHQVRLNVPLCAQTRSIILHVTKLNVKETYVVSIKQEYARFMKQMKTLTQLDINHSCGVQTRTMTTNLCTIQ